MKIDFEIIIISIASALAIALVSYWIYRLILAINPYLLITITMIAITAVLYSIIKQIKEAME